MECQMFSIHPQLIYFQMMLKMLWKSRMSLRLKRIQRMQNQSQRENVLLQTFFETEEMIVVSWLYRFYSQLWLNLLHCSKSVSGKEISTNKQLYMFMSGMRFILWKYIQNWKSRRLEKFQHKTDYTVCQVQMTNRDLWVGRKSEAKCHWSASQAKIRYPTEKKVILAWLLLSLQPFLTILLFHPMSLCQHLRPWLSHRLMLLPSSFTA